MSVRRFCTLAIASAVLASVAPSSRADDGNRFDLPRQALADSLRAVGDQSNYNVFFDPKLVAGRTAPAVQKAGGVEDALRKLLVGSGLTFWFVDERTVTVMPEGQAGPKQPPAAAVQGGDLGMRLAQSEPASAAQEQSSSGSKNLDEIVIEGVRLVTHSSTATKTDTPLLKTPVAISVVPRQVFTDQAVAILDDALKNISGVRSINGGGVNELINLRGFVTNVTFIDGFRINDLFGNGEVNIADAATIEVLKGPASVLYGRSEPGGMVNVVRKKPLESAYYSVSEQVGSWGNNLAHVDATGPIDANGRWLYRVTTSYRRNEQSHAWRDQVGSNEVFVSPTLQWNFNDKTEFTLYSRYAHSDITYDQATWAPYDPVNGKFIWVPRKQNLTYSDDLHMRKLVFGFDWSYEFNDDWSVSHRTIWHQIKTEPSSFTAGVSIIPSGTGWSVIRQLRFLDDESLVKATVLDLTGHVDTGGLKHTILLGADNYNTAFTGQAAQSLPGAPTDVFNPAPAVLALSPMFNLDIEQINHDKGVYLQDQVEFPHNVYLLAGVRYQKSTQHASYQYPYLGISQTPTQNDSATTPRYGLLWQPQPWLSVYGNVTSNFGASNGRAWDGAPLPSQKAENHEVGAKTELLGGKLTSSLALFDLTKTNVVMPDTAHPAPECGGTGCVVLTGEVRSRGLEFELAGELRPNWFFTTAYTYTEARIKSATAGSPLVVGSRLPNTPPTMLNVWTTYQFPGTGWRVGGGANWQTSTTNGSPKTRPNITTPGYAVANLMAAREFTLSRYKLTAQFNVSNVFNHDYYMNATTASVSPITGQVVYGTPRAFRISLRSEF